jgi:hypothetical protein
MRTDSLIKEFKDSGLTYAILLTLETSKGWLRINFRENRSNKFIRTKLFLTSPKLVESREEDQGVFGGFVLVA